MTKTKTNKPKKEEEQREPGSDPILLFSTYSSFCKTIGIEPHDAVKQALTDPEIPNYGKQILIDAREEIVSKPFGAGGCRALATAILGIGPGMPISEKGESIRYTLLKELRIWRSRIGDDGASAIAELLRLGGGDLQLSFLELLGGNIGSAGAKALGRSLSCGMNKSLITLILDFNSELGSDGIEALCQGLRTNSTLKRLSVKYCDIVGKVGGQALGEMLSFPKSAMTVLDLTGNRLGCEGLSAMCSSGLLQNISLTTLNLSENNILSTENDKKALEQFTTVLSKHPCLANLDFMYNAIGQEGGAILLSVLGPENKTITSFRNEFAAVQRLSKKKAKKKKAKGKKKKK